MADTKLQRGEVVSQAIRDLQGSFIDVTLHAQVAFKLVAYIEQLEQAVLASEQAASQPVACDTCKGTGQYCVGTSGNESDGNAPVLERCPECGYGDSASVPAIAVEQTEPITTVKHEVRQMLYQGYSIGINHHGDPLLLKDGDTVAIINEALGFNSCLLAAPPVSKECQPIDGGWYWVQKESIDRVWEWHPAQRERNHWNSAKFSGIPLHEIKVGPPISKCQPNDGKDAALESVAEWLESQRRDITTALAKKIRAAMSDKGGGA